ncbi:unnamed protein product, partial [Porites lobata]
LTGAVVNLIKKKETVRRKLKLHPSESLKVKFQTLRSQVKRAIRESRDELSSLSLLTSSSRSIPNVSGYIPSEWKLANVAPV